MSDDLGQTKSISKTGGDLSEIEAGDDATPARIGRYLIQSVLGSGGFGNVYLAHDTQLLRQVAIKVPRVRATSRHDFCEAFLAEARTLAKLDHPHIVPIFDVGSTAEFPCFLVSKYIDGVSLASRMYKADWNWQRRATLVATIADALHFSHLAGLVHRDVKPGNILLDTSDHAYLADFGLALSDDDYGYSWNGQQIGTLQYMSPEQVRGESHLVDGRADVFSLGVVLYELLTGKRPFAGKSREKVIQNILERDVTPLRQRNSDVPRELERICLRALERGVSRRYSSALDFSEDLQAFCRTTQESRVRAMSSTDSEERVNMTQEKQGNGLTTATPITSSTNAKPVILPKGLRAYDGDDADFFLEVLPGPKDRDGVPNSIRYWKRMIESSRPTESLRIGLLYGPSGCGKSSLISAGLIPRLASHIVPVMVAATPNETESRLQQAIEAACPDLQEANDKEDLARILRRLRSSDMARSGQVAASVTGTSERVILIIIDQFEQWLGEHGGERNQPLINALRQCDGIRLKCLFLVRNDFWMSITQVMEELDSQISVGTNSAAVELFDLRHARNVLFAFGHAYGSLPANEGELTVANREFLSKSVEQLSENGKVICVRLAVYAQMVRDKLWEPSTLVNFGGVDGLGAKFLEETFCGAGASPECRRFHDVARDIFQSLLPRPGSNIRGTLVSEDQLAEVAGLQRGDREFKALLRLLCDELQFLSKSDVLGVPLRGDSDARAVPRQDKYYQLAHDFLVPAIRTWLRAKQQETAAGRALLCLEERTGLWSLNRESRQLPGLAETVQIVRLTNSSRWTPQQTEMMLRAKRLWTRRAAAVLSACLVVLLCIGSAMRWFQQSVRMRDGSALVSQLLTSTLSDTMLVVKQLDQLPEESKVLLEDRRRVVGDDELNGFRVSVALARKPGPDVEALLDECGTVTVEALELAIARLRPLSRDIASSIQDRLERADDAKSQLRYAVLLASVTDDRHQVFDHFSDSIIVSLLSEEPYAIERFSEHFRSRKDLFLPKLLNVFSDTSCSETERVASARVLQKFADSKTIAGLLLRATSSQHQAIMAGIRNARVELESSLAGEISSIPSSEYEDLETARRVANGVFALMQLNPTHECVSRPLQGHEFPQVRTHFMLNCHAYGVAAKSLYRALQGCEDSIARQAMILAVQPYRMPGRRIDSLDAFEAHLSKLATDCENQSERSAAVWVLTQWGSDVSAPSPKFREVPHPSSPRNWWCGPDGQCYVRLAQVLKKSGLQDLNSPEAPGNPAPDNDVRYFGIATHEVSRAEFLKFDPNFQFIVGEGDSDEYPANRVWGVAAMRYCRWLSEQEQIPEDQMCYPPIGEIDESHLLLPDDKLERTSYRLPTEAEWQLACSGGAVTTWSHGSDLGSLSYFAWSAANSEGRLHRSGQLIPNQFGIFDMHGNVGEWCHPASGAAGEYCLRGGNYNFAPPLLATRHLYYTRSNPYSFTGLRPARSINASAP